MSEIRNNQELFQELEYLMIADPAKTVERIESAIHTFDPESSMDDRLHLRRILVMSLSHLSQFEQALNAASDAAALPGADSAPEERARIQLATMQPLAHLGRIDEAIAAGKRAEHQLKNIGSESLAGRASLNIGAIQAMTGHHEESLNSFDSALSLLKDEPILAGQIETNRGTALAALDQFERAEQAFSNARELLGDELPWAAAVVEGNLASLAARQGDLQRSLKHFEASRRHLEKEEALADLGRLDAEEAAVLSMMGMTSISTEYFTRAGVLLREHGTAADLAMARLGFGRALANQGDLERADELLTTAQASLDPDEHPDLYRQYLEMATHVAIEKQDWDTAAYLIESGLASVGDRQIQIARWNVLQAQVDTARGDLRRAEKLLTEALSAAERANVSPLQAKIHEQLYRITTNGGDSVEADEHARRAIDGYEAIRGTIQADQMRKVWHQGQLGIYGDFALSLLGRPDVESQSEAFEIVERIRSRSLLDSFTKGTTFNDDVLSPDEEPIWQELHEHRRWLNWTYSSLAMGRELSEEQQGEIAEREQAAQRLSDRLAILRPETGFSRPVALDEIQPRISEDAVLLSYLIVGDQVAVQIATSNSVESIANLMTAAELGELVSALQFQVGRALVSGTMAVSPRREARLRRDADAVLSQLYSALIEPFEHAFQGKQRCLVIPSGDLHSVPFSALRRDEEYLTESISVTTAPSVSVLAGMLGRENQGPLPANSPLIVGVPDEVAPGLGEEASLLAAEIPGSTLLLDSAANKNAVSASMQRADLVHLACHGRYDPDFPSASGLKLADGWLTLDDVRRLRLNQPLMVLSGCETGRARVDHGDDLVGLMTAMMASGASRLVTSLWKTHDTAAMALMTSFYSYLREGQSVPAALRASQLDVMKSHPHPAMWAPFVGIAKQSRGMLV